MRLTSALLATFFFTTAPAHGEVTASADNGFAVSHKVTVAVDADEAFAMLRTPAKWWAKDHTWTGNADNLYMDAQAGGCFCELIPNEATMESGAPQRTLRGSVQHMQIVYVDPGKMLRMSGALGPLQGEAMSGTLTVSFKPIKGGTQMTFDYVAGGYMRMPVDEIAPAVDQVIGAQASRLAMALGPLVGGDGDGGDMADPADQSEDVLQDEPAPSDAPGTSDTDGSDADAGDPRGSVSDLVADLQPDGEVTGGTAEPGSDAAPVPAKKPRTKPGTRPISNRATSTSPRATSEPETGR